MKAARKAKGILSFFRNTASSRRLVTILCAAVAAAALAIPATAAARTSFPADGNLYFARSTAKLVGETALVPVQCVGTKGSLCSGTISLSVGGGKTEAPFSATSGGIRIVSIPVGSEGLSGSAVVAVAKTALSYGGFATATEVLHLR